MTDLKNRFEAITQQIRDAESAAGRAHESVRLLAVSKTWPATALREVAIAGQSALGENYLQEALNKIQQLSDLSLEWHFIGPIQSNKTRDIATHFDWVHSVDRFKIAKRLNDQRPANADKLNVCIQVNIDKEITKAGIATNELIEFAHQIASLDNLQLRGLMIIPTPTDSEVLQRETFKQAFALFQSIKHDFPEVDTLSMGMTNDMVSAIQEGSTMVRIGTALFGQRN